MSEIIKYENGNITLKDDVLNKLKYYNEIKLKASLLEQEIKRDLQEAMEKYDIKKWDNEVFTATYVAPTTRERLDVKALKGELPEIYRAYKVEGKVSPSVRIKYKEE